MDEKSEVIEMTADIVSAYVGNNTVAAADLPNLIQSVHRALAGVSSGVETVEVAPKEPAVPIRRSITPDHLVCLEDGRKFKSLKRHLRTKYNMSPEEYRAKWGLAKDYPMVAPNYSATRNGVAEAMSDPDDDPLLAAISEAEDAISTVIAGGPPVQLAPQGSRVRQVQHQLAERYALSSRSRGREPHRGVEISRGSG